MAQWEPYEKESYDNPFLSPEPEPVGTPPRQQERGLGGEASTINYLRAILDWMNRNHTDALHTATQIIIVPGYKYHIVRRMITNFHQPQSTLLLLVSAFVGETNWRDIYDYALSHDFRFLSYGDSSLLIP